MKKLLNTKAVSTDGILLFVRIAIAALMLTHGIPKLLMLLSGAPIAFPGILGMGAGLSLGLAVFAEVVCSVLVLLGLGTRLAVIPLIITMAIAVFHIHMADPFAKQELGLHFLVIYVMLLITGSGKYSLDELLAAKLKVQNG